MSGNEGDEESAEEAAQLRQLRLLGVGTVASGLLVVGVDAASTKPHGILVYGLGALGIIALVLERTQSTPVGVSLGLLTGSVIVWLWPWISAGEFDLWFVGTMLVLVGLLNVVGSPVVLYMRRLGERLGERTGGR